MTIASEIEKLQTNLSNSYDVCSALGATMPQSQNFDNLATCISTISGGGGDEIEVLNLTGSALAVGDKAWLSPMYLGSTPDVSQFGTGTDAAFSPKVVSRDGTLVYDTTSGLLFNTAAKTTSPASNLFEMSQGYSGVIKYADNGMIWAYRNVQYSVNYDCWGSVGGNSYGLPTTYAYVGGDYYYDMTNSQFVKMAAGTMNVIKTYTDNTSVGSFNYVYLCGLSFCYANGYIYYKSSNPRIWRAIVDDVAGTVTDDALMLDNTSNTFVLPYVTSDGKYFLSYQASNSSDSGNYFRIYTLVNNTLQEVGDINELSPDLVPFYNNEYTTCVYNQQDDILVITNRSTRAIAVFKYASDKFTKIAGYTDTNFSDSRYWIYATASADGSIISYNTGRRGYTNATPTVVQLQGDAEYKVINYQNINISSSSLTGYVTEGGASGATVKVATVMPEQINVSVTVNANDAIISGGIE